METTGKIQVNSREQRRRYFETVREIHAAGLAGSRLLSELFGVPKSTIERWLAATSDRALKSNHLADGARLKAEAKRRVKAGEMIKDVAASLGVTRLTVSRWVKTLKVRELRAKERGLFHYNLKLLREGFTLNQRIKLLNQAEADGFVFKGTAKRFTPGERQAAILRAKQLRAGGMAVKDIAAQIGVVPSTIGRWVSGVQCPVNHRPKGNPGWRRRGSIEEHRHAA